MKLKKKFLLMGAGLTLGSALLVTSAFADIGGAKGYEAYKAAIKQTSTVTNATHVVALSVRDNGNELLNVMTTVKADEATHSLSGIAAITSGSTVQTIDFHNQEGKNILKNSNSDTYIVIAESDDKEQNSKYEGQHNPAFNQELENVFDSLVGNLKNYVVLSNTAGADKRVDASLRGSQIPAVANLIGSLLVKEALSGDHSQEDKDLQKFSDNPLGLDVKQIAAHFPKLSQDVNIDEVALHATIDENNYIKNQEIDFTISGKDASGQAHKVIISIDIDMSDVNTTTPDTLDLTGKKIKTIQSTEFDH
jgi:F0F1-type ATP synthase membrane subunit c/vacuolar-type H+-ATPase subunit K